MKKLICSFLTVFMLGLFPLTAMAAQVGDIEKVNTVDLLQGSYVVSADGTVKPVPMIDLVGGTELAPGDILYSSSVYFNDSKSAVFNASCQYGDVEKLKVYRGSRSGSTSY